MSTDAPVVLGPSAAGQCRRRVHLDFAVDAPVTRRLPLAEAVRHRIGEAGAHRDRVLHQLRSLFPDAAEALNPTDGWRPPVVVGAVLRTATRFGHPDVLLWAGDGYLPVIIRGHRTTDPGAGLLASTLGAPLDRQQQSTRKARAHPGDGLVLAHYHRMLSELGLASSQAIGGVIGRGIWPPSADTPPQGDDQVIVWHELGVQLLDYDLRFADRLAVADAARAGAPALALPSRVAECRSCAWWPVCSEELTASHDVSLISAGSDVALLQLAGVRTIDQLAELPGSQAAALRLTGMPAGTARVTARAWLAGLPLIRRTCEVKVRRADIELDVDMESYLDDGAYLWGSNLSGPAVARYPELRPGYLPFVSWTELPNLDEGRAFAGFWAYLTGLREFAAAHGLTFAAYCYSRSAEERWLLSTPIRYPEVPGMPSVSQIREFCQSAEWVDIYAEIRAQFVVPGSMKLKVLAPLAGFAWRDSEPGGENSMVWYRAAIGANGTPPDPLMARRVLQYNEDDVLATLALRNWITEHSHDLPTVSHLDAD